MFKVPILYIVYNRPDETSKSFECLRKLQPATLYISADGPNSNRKDDFIVTEKVRSIITEIDWKCELKTHFYDSNQGCRRAVESALEWFFTEQTEGIIIEDDIIPNSAFFDLSTWHLIHHAYSRKNMHFARELWTSYTDRTLHARLLHARVAHVGH